MTRKRPVLLAGVAEDDRRGFKQTCNGRSSPVETHSLINHWICLPYGNVYFFMGRGKNGSDAMIHLTMGVSFL